MNRLRAYRYLEQLTQEELGTVLGVAPQTVSAIESGRRSFTGSLAPIGYADDRLELPEMSAPLHRHRASTSMSAKRRAQELMRLAGEVFKELRARTARAPRLTLERLEPPTTPDGLEELALDVRSLLGHEEDGPIRNLTASIEAAGVCLIPLPNLKGIDGISAWVEDVPVIGISPSIPGDRFRLTLGHELAHLLIHTRRSETSESEANRFAGALLFPQHEFDDAMQGERQLRYFISMKSAWGVSVAALVYRAHQLDYIDDRRYRALQIQMSKWRKSEPASFEPVHGSLVRRLIEVNGGAQGVAQLGFNPKHVHQIAEWRHLRVA